MSKHETPMILRYWEETGGTLVEEFLAVRRAKGQGQRLLDGVIVHDGQTRRLRNRDYDPDDLRGRDIIVVQAKRNRLGMYLLGQALFSRELMKRFSPRTIKTVALCERDDATLGPLAERHCIEVVCYGGD